MTQVIKPRSTAGKVHSTENHEWPLVLRLTGLWLIWSTWASSTGWFLSAIDSLNKTGYLVSSVFLIGFWMCWWKHTNTSGPALNLKFGICFNGNRHWLLRCFQLIALLSLIAALIHHPWSRDADTYRLPRCLYWLAQNHWYWIDTIDGRLDYSSCGLEWQMIPVMLLSKTDQFLFLLSYLPFLLLPGLTYLGGRTLGVARKPLLIWMWLLPSAYCIALQCSGLCNDGYSTSYTAASLAFAGVAIRRRNPLACVFAGLAASLLTGAKLSNLPLMLPLGILLLVSAWRCSSQWRPILASTLVMALTSFLPLAMLSQINTGNWTGDPDDQWGFRTGNPVAAVVANLVLASNDLLHPPIVPASGVVNAAILKMESGIAPLMNWLEKSHHMFRGVKFGDLVYEGGAGAGFSIGCLLIGGTLIGLFIRSNPHVSKITMWQQSVIAGGVLAWLVLLSQLGSSNSPRNAISYLPLLAIAYTRVRPFHRFLYSKAAQPLALFSMLSVIPIIILTPARPLLPLGLLAKIQNNGATSGTLPTILKKYQMWKTLRDDLKPMRDHLPPGESLIGFAGAFVESSYGLWKPFGCRTIQEIGIPLKDLRHHAPVPNYVVATEQGIQRRFGQSIPEWLKKEHKEIRYSFKRADSLEYDDGGGAIDWYLLGPTAGSANRKR